MSKVSAGFVSVSLLVAASAQEPIKFNVPGVSTPAAQPSAPAAQAPAPAAPAAAPATTYSEAQLMEAYGYIFALESRIANQIAALEFTQAQKDAMLRGLGLALNGKDLPYDAKQIQEQLQVFIGKKQETFMTKLRNMNLTEGQAFFTKLKENKNVVEQPNGLRYEITTAGKGAIPKVGQVVTVHFTGALANGQVFGSTLQPRQEGGAPEPQEFLLDMERGLPGLVEGLLKFPAGSKGKIYIPPSLGFGDSGDGRAIPPGATLIFEVEVLAVKDAPKEAAPAAK